MCGKVFQPHQIDIRFIGSSEWEEAVSLVYSVFIKFDAPEFTEEGIKHFRDFLRDNYLKRMFEEGYLDVIGAYSQGKLVGVIALRNDNHISLLFVDGDYHNNGIGSRLFYSAADYARLKLKQEILTVNSSPYAVGFYHSLGFKDRSGAVTQDGIIYTPMEYRL